MTVVVNAEDVALVDDSKSWWDQILDLGDKYIDSKAQYDDLKRQIDNVNNGLPADYRTTAPPIVIQQPTFRVDPIVAVGGIAALAAIWMLYRQGR